jgi:DNA-binding MarR family transcriptional regulator
MPEITPEECAAEVMEAMPIVMQFIRAEMRRQGANFLSVPQFRALRFLSQHPGASLSELAEHLGVTRATASSIVERLVRRGLVNREEHPEERRRNLHTLTTEGSQLLQRARHAARSSLARVLNELSTAKLQDIATGASLLKEAFSGCARHESDCVRHEKDRP